MTNKPFKPEFEIRPEVSLQTLTTSHGPNTPFSPGQPRNWDERWIEDEFRKRIAIEQAIVMESFYAHNAFALLELHGVSVYQQTAETILDIKNSQEDEELQTYLDPYSRRTLENLATRQFALNKVAETNIAYTVYRDHYPPEREEVIEEQKTDKGWWQRLLGV